MTAYQRGDYFEKRVKAALEDDGYFVWQTRGSKSPADLIALKPGQVVLVQVKGGSTAIDGAGWNALLDLAGLVAATPVVATRAGRRIAYREVLGRHEPGSHTWLGRAWTPDVVVHF